MNDIKKESVIQKVKDGFWRGLGTAIGLTIGFAIVSTLLINLIRLGGGLPIVGNFFASIVDVTQVSLERRN